MNQALGCPALVHVYNFAGRSTLVGTDQLPLVQMADLAVVIMTESSSGMSALVNV